jgi:hypothetical protein
MGDERRLTDYEAEVLEALTERRDTGLALRDAIDRDVANYDAMLDAVAAGGAMKLLVPPTAGEIRQELSDRITAYEAARHRFRLAAVALAVDNGMTAREIGDVFAFSPQLAGRYLSEARIRWPDLQEPHHGSEDGEDGAPTA